MWLLWTTSQSSLGLTRYYHNNNNASKCEAALRPTLLLEALHKNTCDNRCCCCDNSELDPNVASMDHIPIIFGSNSLLSQQQQRIQVRGLEENSETQFNIRTPAIGRLSRRSRLPRHNINATRMTNHGHVLQNDCIPFIHQQMLVWDRVAFLH